MTVSIQNPGTVYEATCPNGHFNNWTIAHHRFALLYEAGISALKDGYYREAVVNFAASLERYLELTIKVIIATKNEIVNEEEFAKTWREMRNKSELQQGAFQMLFFSVFDQAPPLFDVHFMRKHNLDLKAFKNNPVEFRNAVTHKGEFPTHNQAVIYGEAVLKYMLDLIAAGQNLSYGYVIKFQWYATTADMVKDNVNRDTPMPNWSNKIFLRLHDLFHGLAGFVGLDESEEFRAANLKVMMSKSLFERV